MTDVPQAQQAEENATFTINNPQDLPTNSVAITDYVSLEEMFSPTQFFEERDNNRFRSKQYLNQLQDSNNTNYTSGVINFKGKDLASNQIDYPHSQLSIPLTAACASGGASTDVFFLKAGHLGFIRGMTVKTTSNTTIVDETQYMGPYYAKKFLLDSSLEKVQTEGPAIGLFGFPADSSQVDPVYVRMLNFYSNGAFWNWNSALSVMEGELRIELQYTSEYWDAQRIQQLGYNMDVQVYNNNGKTATTSGSYVGEYIPFIYIGSGLNPTLTIGNSYQQNCIWYYDTVVLPPQTDVALAKQYSGKGRSTNVFFKTLKVGQQTNPATSFTLATFPQTNLQIVQDVTRPTRIFFDTPQFGALTSYAPWGGGPTGSAGTGAMTGSNQFPLVNANIQLTTTNIRVNGTKYYGVDLIRPYDFYKVTTAGCYSRGENNGRTVYTMEKYFKNPQNVLEVVRVPSILGSPDAGCSIYGQWQVNTNLSATGTTVNQFWMIESETAVVQNQTNSGTTIGLGSALAQ